MRVRFRVPILFFESRLYSQDLLQCALFLYELSQVLQNLSREAK